MRALVKEILQARVSVYNPEHSFVVSGVGHRRLCHYVSQIPGVIFAPKRDDFSYRGFEFSIDDGGDTGGDGLWIMTKDHLPHANELRAVREEIERMINEDPPSKARKIVVWLVLVGVLLTCIGISFATVHTLTALPIWASAVISIPSGAGLFYVACKFA